MTVEQEMLIGDLIYARARKVTSSKESDRIYFSGMAIGLEGALKVIGVKDIELAIVEYDLKYDR